MLLFEKKCPNCDTYYDPTLNQCPTCHKDNELYAQRDICKNVVFLHPLAQMGLFLGGFSYGGMVICGVIATFFCSGVASEILKNGLILLFAYLMMLAGLLTIPVLTRREAFFKKFTRPIDYAYGAGFAVAAILAGLAIDAIVKACAGNISNGNQDTAVNLALNYPVLAGFIVILLGSICEEMTYRVGLYSFLKRINRILAFAITVIIFALIHFDFEAANMTNEFIALPSYLVCGFILTLAYEMRGPASSITAHVLYNLFAFIMIFVER